MKKLCDCKAYEKGMRFCPECGIKYLQECPYCGKEILYLSNNCKYCAKAVRVCNSCAKLNRDSESCRCGVLCL